MLITNAFSNTEGILSPTFVKNRITTIHSNSVVKNGWVPGSQELNIIAFKR